MKKLNPNTLYRVRVTFKNPLKEKTKIMSINGKTIDYYRRSNTSPYKNITVLGGER